MICLSQGEIQAFCDDLLCRERSLGTVEQYRRSLKHLLCFLGTSELTRDALLRWKEGLTAQKAVPSVNCMIAAVNRFVEFMEEPGLKLKTLKCQRKIFSEEELTREEFRALVLRARKEGDVQTALLLKAMSETGVRVSEVQFLTVEAARQRAATIRLKGKTRQILLGDKLCAELLDFAESQRITEGPIFLGKRGKPLDRRRIWERMKRLCARAGVDPKKVHPHALRHLFARLFYDMTQDIAKLADLLGHSSIETTRIYVMTSSREHRTILDRLASCLSTKKPPRKGGRKRRRT